MPACRLTALLLVLVVTACAEPVPAPPTGPATVYVIERGWHTDIALPVSEIYGPLAVMTEAYPEATFLTFGFGERQFLITRTPSVGLMLSAMLPSRSAVLMTALKAPPEAAFGSRNVVALRASQAALEGLEAALWQAMSIRGMDCRSGWPRDLIQAAASMPATTPTPVISPATPGR